MVTYFLNSRWSSASGGLNILLFLELAENIKNVFFLSGLETSVCNCLIKVCFDFTLYHMINLYVNMSDHTRITSNSSYTTMQNIEVC